MYNAIVTLVTDFLVGVKERPDDLLERVLGNEMDEAE
jgi:hypothetical protein